MDSHELLHRAAKDMREQHGPEHARHEFWTRLADWLDSVAVGLENRSAFTPGAGHALAVARAYLGKTS